MKNFRWVIIALTFVASIINYLDRAALSYAITPLQKEFHLNNTQFGLIAAGFGIGYIFMTVTGGVLVDRRGARKIWSIAGLAWSLVSILFGVATGFWSLFLLRVLLGVTEGPAFPALTRVATDWLPKRERARALAFGLAAVPFASVIGAPLISALIINFGWRIMFIILGLLGIIWVIIWHTFFRDQPQDSKYVSASEATYIKHSPAKNALKESQTKTSWRFILFTPGLIANNYAFFSFGYLLFFALTWLPGYLEQTYSLKLKEVAIFVILPWLFGTIFILIGGFLSDWLWKKTESIRASRTHIIWVCQILSALCFIPVALLHSLPIAIIFISLGIGIGLMPNAAFYALNADIAKDRVATSLGVMDCAFAAAGFLAPFLTGILSHITGNFVAALLLLTILSFTSALGVFLFQHPDRTLRQKFGE